MVVRNIPATVTTAPARTAAPTQAKLNSDGSGSKAAAADGKSAPGKGESLPPQAPIDIADLARAAERLQRLAREASRNLEFHVDEASGRTVITVINEATQEIVRQIPAEEVLALARSMSAFSALLDAEA